MKIHIGVILYAICISRVCYSQNCNTIPSHVQTYESVIFWIRDSNFKLSEKVNTPNSSWIRKAEYYSCDEKTGYLIFLTTKGKKYIHKGVPIYLWNNFKKSNSHGEFYNDYIRGKYRFSLR